LFYEYFSVEVNQSLISIIYSCAKEHFLYNKLKE
jgi:hypothetical protein